MPNAGRLRLRVLGALANQLVRVGPAAFDALVLFRNKAETGVRELDQRLAALLAEPVLDIVGNRLRHEERPAEFKQGRPLDRLHHAPAVAVAIAEIAEPAPTGPRFDLEGHWRAVGLFIGRAHLLQQRSEGHVNGSLDANFLGDFECEGFDVGRCFGRGRHTFSLKRFFWPSPDYAGTATSLGPSDPFALRLVPSRDSLGAASMAQTFQATHAACDGRRR